MIMSSLATAAGIRSGGMGTSDAASGGRAAAGKTGSAEAAIFTAPAPLAEVRASPARLEADVDAALPAASSVAPPSFNKRRLRIVTWPSAARPPDAAAALWKEPDIFPPGC